MKINCEPSKDVVRTNTSETLLKLHENSPVNEDYANSFNSNGQKITTVNDDLRVLTKEQYKEVVKRVNALRRAEHLKLHDKMTGMTRVTDVLTKEQNHIDEGVAGIL